MAEYYVPSNFLTVLTEGECQVGDDSDGLFDLDAFNAGDFNPNFDDDVFLEYPDAVASQQNVLQANEHSGHGDARDSLPNGKYQRRSEPNEFVEDQGEVSSLQIITQDSESSRDNQRQDDLAGGYYPHQLEPRVFGKNQEGITNFENLNAANASSEFHQTQEDLRGSDDQPSFGLNEAAATNTFSNVEPVGGLANELQAFHSESGVISSEGWINNENHAANEASSATTNSVAQDEEPIERRPKEAKRTESDEQRSHRRQDHQHQGTNSGAAGRAKIFVAETDPSFDPADDLGYYAEDPETGVVESRRREGWGRTGTRNGVEVWFNPETNEWQESASHHSYREVLIARAQAEHPRMRYSHPDESDGTPHNETSFFLPHQNLGPDRVDCPDECFVWPQDEPEDKSEDREAVNNDQRKRKRKPNPRPRGPLPGFWYEDNKILLDPHNNPVKKYLDIPLTLSANTEGCKLDLMRILNPSISQKDLWARMPRWIRRQVPKTETWVVKYIGSPNTHVNMPSVRFRAEKAAVAGNIREGSQKLREGLKALFAEYGFDPILTGSTRGFGRDLLPWEQELVKLGNAGRHPNRAGESRALDEETRNANMQKTLKRIERGRKRAEAEAASPGSVSTGPHRHQGRASHDSNLAPQKAKQGRRLRSIRAKQTSSQTQRHDTNGAASTQHQDRNVLEAENRPYNSMNGEAPSPYQNTNPFDGNQQALSLGNDPSMRRQKVPFYPGAGRENDPNLYQLQQELGTQPWSAQGTVEQNYYPRAQHQAQYQHEDLNPTFPSRNHYISPFQPQGPFAGTSRAPTRGVNTLGPGGRRIQEAPKQVLGKRRQEDYSDVDGYEDWSHNGAIEGGRPIPISQDHQDPDIGPSHKRRRNNITPGTQPRPQRRRNGMVSRPGYYGAGGAPVPHLSPEGGPSQATQTIFATVGVADGRIMPPEELFASMPHYLDVHVDAVGQPSDITDNYQGNTVYTINERTVSFDGEARRQGGQYLAFPRQKVNHGPDTNQPSGRGDLVEGSVYRNNNNNIYNGTALSIDFGNTPNSNGYQGQSLLAASDKHQQILGKHRREEPVDEWEQGIREQEQTAHEGHWEEDTHEPKPKRRRIPAIEGYSSPPAQASRVPVSKKARKAERDAHLSPPELRIKEMIPRIDHTANVQDTSLHQPQLDGNGNKSPNMQSNPQVEDAHPMSPGIYINGSDTNFEELYQEANATDTIPPRASMTEQAEQQPFDIRDKRPVTRWQRERLRDAIGLTRDAYQEWTGEEAPATNLEHSYNMQYQEIRAAFQAWWDLNEAPLRLGPRPELWCLKAWNGAVEDWKAPENMEHLHAAMASGMWVARNEDSTLEQRDFHYDHREYDDFDSVDDEDQL